MNNPLSLVVQEIFPGITELSYASIFSHFEFGQVPGQLYNQYSKVGTAYQVYRTGEQSYYCFNTKSLRGFNKPELLIELSQSNDLNFLQQLCRAIKPTEQYNDINLVKPVSAEQALSNVLSLKKISNDSERAFTLPQLKDRIFSRNNQIAFPLYHNNKIVNIAFAGTQYYYNYNLDGSWSSQFEEGAQQFIFFNAPNDVLAYCNGHTLDGSFAYLVADGFPDHRLLEVLQWIHKNDFTEFLFPYTTNQPWLFVLRLYCQLVNIELPRVSISFEGGLTSSKLSLTFKSTDQEFPTQYSAFISELNKTSRQKIKKYMTNPNTYEEEPFTENYFLFQSENRALASKSLKSLTCFNTPNNAQVLLDELIKKWPVKIKISFLSLY